MENEKARKALDDVLAHQAQIAETERMVAELETAISQQQEAIRAANAFTTNLPGLLTQRENLLADIALGKGVQGHLDELNEVIAKEQEQLDWNTQNASAVTETSKQAIAGLQRKLEVAKLGLTQLRAARHGRVDEFLLLEAELVGSDYHELASQLTRKYRQLLAIDKLLKRHDFKAQGVAPLFRYDLQIPLFRLKGAEGLDHSAYRCRFYEAERTRFGEPHSRLTENYQEEVKRIEAMGVAL